MKNEFAGFGLRPSLLEALTKVGYQEPTPVQRAVIGPMLEGRDVIAQARTGTGKTAAFALPALHNLDLASKQTQVLVLSPTRELAQQVGKSFEQYGAEEKVTILTIYGGASYGHQKGVLRKGAQVVVGTPGRLLDLVAQGNLELGKVKLLVLDEADEMLSMGFTEEVEQLISHLPSERQTTLFSATLPEEIQRLARTATKNALKVNLSQEVSTSNVELSYFLVEERDKIAAATRLFETEQVSSALVFCRTRVQTAVLAAKLTSYGVPAEALSGAMEQDAREMVLRRFRNEVFRVLVATDVAARGLDIDHLSHVINLDLPQSPDVFVHRIGRVGRAGRTGSALTLVTPKEEWKLQRIERAIKRSMERRKVPSKKEITRIRIENLYLAMRKWLESDRCKKEISYVEELQAAGFEAKKIAAAALKLAGSTQKEQPIADMSVEEELQPARPSRARRDSKTGADTVQLVATIGKKQGVKVKELVFVLSKFGKVPARMIGNIRISKTRSFVDVPPSMVSKVLKSNGSYKIGRHRFTFAPDS
ncbi:MAG: DEAD/DEAH box helicase [Vulcanimicrobiota bacterium]